MRQDESGFQPLSVMGSWIPRPLAWAGIGAHLWCWKHDRVVDARAGPKAHAMLRARPRPVPPCPEGQRPENITAWGIAPGPLFMRMGRDSNPRWTFAHSGFQDRRLRPLGHPSEPIPWLEWLSGRTMPRTNADIGLTLQVRGDKQPPARQQRQNYHTQGTSSRLGCPWLGKPSRFGFRGFSNYAFCMEFSSQAVDNGGAPV